MLETYFTHPSQELVLTDLNPELIWDNAKKFDPHLYLEYFEQNYPKAFELIKLGGIYPYKEGVSPEMKDPYNETVQKGNFTNIGEHVISAGFCFQAIAKPLKDVGYLTQIEFEAGTEGALTHDASKRWEIMRKDYAKKNPEYSPYSDEAYSTVKEVLFQQGIAEDLIERMVQAGLETGGQSFSRFIEITDSDEVRLKPRRMVDKILHLADDMTATANADEGSKPATVFLTSLERVVASNFKTRYPFGYVDGIGFDEQGMFMDGVKNVLSVPNLRRANIYFFYQPFIANAICRQIQAVLSPESCELPEYFVKNLVNRAF